MTDQFATQFPYHYPINGCFVVQNIINNSNKTIKVFDYPIPVGMVRDLLRIPGVSESSIRASLLKGELRNKIIAKEIRVICSDIDLIQFNDDQKIFLLSNGVDIGLEAGESGTGDLTTEEHSKLRQLIHFIDDGPGDGFASGAYKAISGQPFPTSIIWYTDNTETSKIVEKTIVYNAEQLPTVVVWKMYDEDGSTVLHTVQDTIAYNGVFENSRTRTIS
jgi:hypothetical protein